MSEPANTKEYLDELNNATVTYNGKKMSMYDATQVQRSMERNIRRWKREYNALSKNGQDDTGAALKLRSWREREADYLRQTKLPYQGSREQVVGFGRSEAAKATWAVRKSEQLAEAIGTAERARLHARNSNNVSQNALDSPGFIEKFIAITESDVVNKAIYEHAVNILKHRSSTNKEDLVLLDAENGKLIHSLTSSDTPNGVTYNNSVLNAINNAHLGCRPHWTMAHLLSFTDMIPAWQLVIIWKFGHILRPIWNIRPTTVRESTI